jgi:hypothetical protein
MVVVAMRNGNGIHVMGTRLAKTREGFLALSFGMHAGIKQDTMLVQLHQPTTRANLRIPI